MRSMIRCYNVNRVIKHCLKDLRPVVRGFYRRVPLDEISFFSVVFITEPEVMNTRFGCDLFFSERDLICKQRQFFGSRNVQYVQSRSKFLSECCCLRRRTVTSLFASDDGMKIGGNLVCGLLL